MPAIVVAGEADIEGIIDLFEAVAAEGRWIGTELPIDRERRATSIRATLARKDALTLVAIDAPGRAIVGNLALIPRSGGLLELGMIVDASLRSQGVGSALLASAIEGAKNLGAHKIILEVFPHNGRAIRLYERHGFEREGFFRRHYRRRNGELWDALPMGLSLG